jgi:hypothetical protein
MSFIALINSSLSKLLFCSRGSSSSLKSISYDIVKISQQLLLNSARGIKAGTEEVDGLEGGRGES